MTVIGTRRRGRVLEFSKDDDPFYPRLRDDLDEMARLFRNMKRLEREIEDRGGVVPIMDSRPGHRIELDGEDP